MQILNLIFTTLLALEVSLVAAGSSHKHSKSSTKALSSTTLSKSSAPSSKASSSASKTTSTSVDKAYVPGENWSTLTPSNTYQCGFTNYTSTFGVAVKTITFDAESSASSKGKRDLVAPTQAVDVVVGQVRALASTTGASSGVEVTTTFTRTKTIVSTSVSTLAINSTALNETALIGYNLTLNGSFVNASFANISFANGSFYGNSSLINSTYLNNTASFLNQTHKVNTTSYNSTLTKCTAKLPDFFNDVSCQSNTTLSVTLENGVLKDSTGKIGSIVSSHQFQFNGPWPAEGTLFAAGWSITPESTLALGDNDIFYECLTGDGYYDLFNEFIGSQCIPIQLEVVTLVEC